MKVFADDGVSISNLYMGDLMDEDLRSYILSALHLNSADLVSAYYNPDNDDELIYHYDAGRWTSISPQRRPRRRQGLRAL